MKKSATFKQREKTTSSDFHLLRQFYADELRAVANLQSEALVRAFAKVPREHFLGPGPWQVKSPGFEGTGRRRMQIRKSSITISSWRSIQVVCLTTVTPAFWLL